VGLQVGSNNFLGSLKLSWVVERQSAYDDFCLYIPAWVGTLEFSFPILAAGGNFAPIDESCSVQVEPSGGKPKDVFAQFLLLETLLGDGSVSLGMDVLCLDRGDISSIPWDG
jgi:hypothetical protein